MPTVNTQTDRDALSSIVINVTYEYYHSPLVTMGLDPILSKVITSGYGPDFIVEYTVLVAGGAPSQAHRRRHGSLTASDRIIRIRVIDESGKVMIQERLIEEETLKNISFRIDENFTISGSDIYIAIKQQQVKENTPSRIVVKINETHKR